jgi:dihydroorotase
MANPASLSITQPDDWHVHLRQDHLLAMTVRCMQPFARAIVMPNTKPPITTIKQALDYKKEILRHCLTTQTFDPLMTLYLTPTLDPKTLLKAKEQGIIGCKYYPYQATTNADYGFKEITDAFPLLAIMEQTGLILQVHAEDNQATTDVFDKETLFITQHLNNLSKTFPKLRIVIEHITKAETVARIQQAPANIASTITVHHLLFNRNHLLNTKINPHLFCLPVLKRQADQMALMQAALSGSKKFFFGSDSAPHTQQNKETACGCAGVFSSPVALSLLTELFAKHHALDKLEGFISFFGADFYQVPRNQDKITLIKKPWTVPKFYSAGKNQRVIPLASEQTLSWQAIYD